MTTKKKEVFFHPGLGKTGTTYLQYKFFPKINNVFYIQRTKYSNAAQIIRNAEPGKFLVSREFDNQFYTEVDRFAAEFPDAWPVIVLRRHSSWIASQYRRIIKNGRGLYFREFIDIDENDGRWDKEVLNFYDKIKKLEASFAHKPLVLFYKELQTNPHTFFGKFARFMGTHYDPNKISLRSKHVSYNENQLKLIRHVARKYFMNREQPQTVKGIKRERRMRKFLSHLVMYFYWAVPNTGWKDEPLIEPEELQKIDERYAGDWNKCKEYARLNHLESLLHTPHIIE